MNASDFLYKKYGIAITEHNKLPIAILPNDLLRYMEEYAVLRQPPVSGSLPTDEDISKKAQEARVDDINDSINRVGGFIVGATWMRDLLKGNDR